MIRGKCVIVWIQIIEEEKVKSVVAILLTRWTLQPYQGALEVMAHFGIKVYAEHERDPR